MSENPALVAHLDQIQTQAGSKTKMLLPYLNHSWVLALVTFVFTGLLLLVTDSPLIQHKKHPKNADALWEPTRSLGKLVGYSTFFALCVLLGPTLWTFVMKYKKKIIPSTGS